MHIFPDGRRYIGATRQDPKKRWHHGSGYKNAQKVYAEIQKFGWDSIEHVIVKGQMDKESAMKLEKELIAKYKTQDPTFGLNTKGGGQSFGEHSEEFLASLKGRMVGNKYCVGRKLSESHIEAMINGSKKVKHNTWTNKKHHTDETRERLSALRKLAWQDDEYRRKMSESHPDFSGSKNPMYGKTHSAETREKISASHRGKKLSPEHIEKLKGKNQKPVVKLDKNGMVLERFPSVHDAAASVNAKPANIGFCCRNYGRTAKGFEWRYEHDYGRGTA